MGYAITAEYDKEMDGRTRFHRFRYHLARGFLDPKDLVLDLGCGTGYGTKILSGAAKKVIGVDFEQSNINYCIEKHQSDNIEFVLADLEKWSIPKCDVAVQFENLEHLYKPKEFVAKLKKKVAKFIIASVPLGQKIIMVDGDPQEEGDKTHHSAFQTPEEFSSLFIDNKWKEFWSFRDGVTFIAVYYNNSIENQKYL